MISSEVLKPVLEVLLKAAICLGILLATYTVGYQASESKHELREIQKQVLDLTIIQNANQADREKAVEQASEIERLNKEITNVRNQLSDKARVCFDPVDTNRLRSLWKREPRQSP